MRDQYYFLDMLAQLAGELPDPAFQYRLECIILELDLYFKEQGA